MGMLVVTGDPDYYNALARGILTVSSENSLYPKSRLYDRRPSKDFRFNAAGVDDTITLDGSIITNAARTTDEGKLDGWTGSGPDGWTRSISGTGAVSQESVTVRSGSAARIEPGTSGTAALYRDFVVRAGQPWTIEAWLRGGAGSGVCRAEVQNLQTKKYLTSAGAWQTAQADWATEASLGYVQKSRQFSVEGYAACLADTVTLRVRFYNTVASGTAYVEDIAFFPSIDTASLHGHNIDPSIAVQIRHSDDNFTGADVLAATFTQPTPKPTSYVTFTQTHRRYWRYKFVGTNSAPIEIGEAALFAAVTPQQQYEAPIFWRQQWDRQFSRTPSGERFGHKRSKFKRRFPTFTYHYTSQAQLDDALAIWDRAEGGTHPLIVIPDTTRPEVIHGYLPDDFSIERELDAYYTGAEIPIDESPFTSTAT